MELKRNAGPWCCRLFDFVAFCFDKSEIGKGNNKFGIFIYLLDLVLVVPENNLMAVGIESLESPFSIVEIYSCWRREFTQASIQLHENLLFCDPAEHFYWKIFAT